MAASAAAALDGAEAIATRTSPARPQIAATMAAPLTPTNWMVAHALAQLVGVVTLARLISLASPWTATTMAQPLTATNWMAALAAARPAGVDLLVTLTSAARLTRIAAVTAQLKISTVLMVATAHALQANKLVGGQVTVAMRR